MKPTSYDHPNGPQTQLAPEPILLGNARRGFRRPSINQILAAASYYGVIHTRETLSALTYTSGGTLDNFLKFAHEEHLIEDVGRLAHIHPLKPKKVFFYGRKAFVREREKQKTRGPLEVPDELGLNPGARFLTTKGSLVRPHDLLATQALGWLVSQFRLHGIIAVGYAEDYLREVMGWHSLRKVSSTPRFLTEVSDGLVLADGMIVHVEMQLTDKPKDYVHKCAACYGEPVVYITPYEKVYRTLKNLDPKPENLFVAKLWSKVEGADLISQLRNFSEKPPYEFNQNGDHYSRDGFVYGAINPASVPAFLADTKAGQLRRKAEYAKQSRQQREEKHAELTEKAQEAFTYFHVKSEAKQAEAEESMEQEFKEKFLYGPLREHIDQMAKIGKRKQDGQD